MQMITKVSYFLYLHLYSFSVQKVDRHLLSFLCVNNQQKALDLKLIDKIIFFFKVKLILYGNMKHNKMGCVLCVFC